MSCSLWHSTTEAEASSPRSKKGGRSDAIPATWELRTALRCSPNRYIQSLAIGWMMLVLNAGISKAATIADHTVEDFDNLFATNVRSPFSWCNNSCQFSVTAQTSLLSLPPWPER